MCLARGSTVEPRGRTTYPGESTYGLIGGGPLNPLRRILLCDAGPPRSRGRADEATDHGTSDRMAAQSRVELLFTGWVGRVPWWHFSNQQSGRAIRRLNSGSASIKRGQDSSFSETSAISRGQEIPIAGSL